MGIVLVEGNRKKRKRCDTSADDNHASTSSIGKAKSFRRRDKKWHAAQEPGINMIKGKLERGDDD